MFPELGQQGVDILHENTSVFKTFEYGGILSSENDFVNYIL
jgi:hypothetical protein